MANPAPVYHSHRNTNSDAGSGGLNSPQSRRSSSAAWTQVVRGSVGGGEPEQPESIPPATSEAVMSSSPEDNTGAPVEGSSSDNVAKKPAAWKKPSNGGGGAADDVISSAVMGGVVSWPALSDSTNKASPKSSPSFDSLKALSSDGSVQGTGMSLSSHRQANTNNAIRNSTPNHVAPTRQRSMKRGGGNSNHNALANGGFSQQQAQGFAVEITPNSSGKAGNSAAESSSWDNGHKDGGQRGGFGSQSHGGNEHQHQRNSNRKGNVGPHTRGDGAHHHSYGGRRDQERGNQDWNPHRGWGNRDARVQPQRGAARPFMRGPPLNPLPFIPPSSVQFYPGPMFNPGSHSDPLRMPMLAPMPPFNFPIPDPQLHTKIVNQIDYYFSNENLIKDTFLRQNMDGHGWVPVTLIAGFKKVMQLTENIQLILDAVRSSTVVEVQGEMLRRRNDWDRWIMPPSAQNSSMSSPQSLQKSSLDLLAEDLQSVAFDDKTIIHGNTEAYLSRSSSTELSTAAKQFGNERAGQAGAQHAQPMPVGNPS